MKRNTILFFLGVLLIGLIGCSRLGTRLDANVEWEQDGSIGMTYTMFDGRKDYTVTLEEPSAFGVEVHSDGGVLKLEIIPTGEEPIYSGHLTEDFSFTVNAQPGEYTVRLTGDHHAGRFELKWGNKNASDSD